MLPIQHAELLQQLCWEHFSGRQGTTKQLVPLSYAPQHCVTSSPQPQCFLRRKDILSRGGDCLTSALQRHSKTKSCWWVVSPQRWGQWGVSAVLLRLEPGKASAYLGWYPRYLQCCNTTFPQDRMFSSPHPAPVPGITS